MKNKVLIFPSGAENALEIYRAIKNSIHVEVIPASGRDDYSQVIYESKVRKLPFIGEADFIDALNVLIEKEEINLIFPTDDTAALYLTEKSSQIKAKIISSDYETNLICRYKKKTYELLKKESFCPMIFNNPLPSNEYPIFAKPDVGQGSQGARLVNSRSEHEQLITDKELIFLEYLPGKEYTVDCFTDKVGNLLFSGVRERAEIKMGISFRSREKKLTKEIKDIADKINNMLNFRGLWFFQLKESKDGSLKLLEISTRTAGTMGFFRHKGINLPLLSVFDALDNPVEIMENSYELELFRTTINVFKYGFEYDKVYIDYDDTLIINGKVNSLLMRYIYHLKNKNKIVILITKHEKDIYTSLEEKSICSSLFDQIFQLNLEESKSDYIDSNKSIFIDNWYLERKEVFEVHKIPVFDVDAVESLIVN